MAIIAKEKFTDDRMRKLYDYLKANVDFGEPVDYEIIVDGFRAVRRTDDVNRFNLYENFVNPSTKGIEVLFYVGNSNNNEKHIFTFGEDEPKETGLSGIEVDQRIQEGIEREKKSWQFDELKKRNKDLEQEVAELEAEVATLNAELKITEGKKKESSMNGFLGEMGSAFVESLIRRNPALLSKIPGGDALAGMIEEDNKRMEENPQQEEAEPEVTFRAKPEDNREAQEALEFVNYLKGRFTKEQFNTLNVLIDLLAEAPEKMDEFIVQLKQKEDGNVPV